MQKLEILVAPEAGISTRQIVSRIFDIHRKYIDEDRLGFRPPVTYMDACEKGQVLLAFEPVEGSIFKTDQIVGFAHYRRKKNKTIRLYAIAVEDTKRGMGIGSALLDRIKHLDGRRIETEVKVTNEDSQNFFVKNGFVQMGKKIKGIKREYEVYEFYRLTEGPYWYWDEFAKKRRKVQGF